MNYRELHGMAYYHEWAAKMIAPINIRNEQLRQERQKLLDQRKDIGVGDFVLEGEKVWRVAYDWGDTLQLTDGRYGASFYLGKDGHLSFSGGLDPGIDKTRFQPTTERREGSVWFFSEDWVIGHNGFDTSVQFKVWTLV